MATLAYSFDDILLPVRFSDTRHRKDADISTYITRNPDIKIGVPLVASPMKTVTGATLAQYLNYMGAVGVIHRFHDDGESDESIRQQASEVASVDGLVGAAIGVKEGWEKRVDAVLEAGAGFIMVDIAHGNSILQYALFKTFKKKYPQVPIIAANVSDADGVKRFAALGANGIRIGIGGGSLCSTRIKTGFGVPSVTCLQQCYKAKVDGGYDLALLQDGGIRNSGDINKSLALGADAVIIGSLFVGCPESAAPTVNDPQRGLIKLYMGSASADSKGEHRYVEGSKIDVPVKWSICDEVRDLVEGIKSGFSYGGAHDIDEFRKNLQDDIIIVTQGGLMESLPHLHFRRGV